MMALSRRRFRLQEILDPPSLSFLLHARGRWTRIAPMIFKAICSAVFVVCLLVLAACPVPPPQGGERSNPSAGQVGLSTEQASLVGLRAKMLDPFMSCGKRSIA